MIEHGGAKTQAHMWNLRDTLWMLLFAKEPQNTWWTQRCVKHDQWNRPCWQIQNKCTIKNRVWDVPADLVTGRSALTPVVITVVMSSGDVIPSLTIYIETTWNSTPSLLALPASFSGLAVVYWDWEKVSFHIRITILSLPVQSQFVNAKKSELVLSPVTVSVDSSRGVRCQVLPSILPRRGREQSALWAMGNIKEK